MSRWVLLAHQQQRFQYSMLHMAEHVQRRRERYTPSCCAPMQAPVQTELVRTSVSEHEPGGAGAAGCFLLCLVLGLCEAFTLYVLSKFSERYQARTYSGLVRRALGRKLSASECASPVRCLQTPLPCNTQACWVHMPAQACTCPTSPGSHTSRTTCSILGPTGSLVHCCSVMNVQELCDAQTRSPCGSLCAGTHHTWIVAAACKAAVSTCVKRSHHDQSAWNGCCRTRSIPCCCSIQHAYQDG